MYIGNCGHNLDINGIGTDGHSMIPQNSWKKLASLQTSNFKIEKEIMTTSIQAIDVLVMVSSDFCQTHFSEHWIKNRTIRSEIQRILANKWMASS